MRPRTVMAALVMAWGVVVGSVAQGAPRYLALLIGNADYQGRGVLKNPVRDVEAVSNALEARGFTVAEKTNLDKKSMRQAVRDLADQASDEDIVLLYYSGHGMEISGANYLLGTDFAATSEEEGKDDGYALSTVLATLGKSKAKARVVVLDACRDDPWSKSWARSGASRGFVSVQQAPENIFIIFSTSPGHVASDGLGKPHSPFAQAFLDTLGGSQGAKVQDFVIDVVNHVSNSTGSAQIVWNHSSLSRKDVFLGPPPTSSLPTLLSPQPRVDLISPEAGVMRSGVSGSTSPPAAYTTKAGGLRMVAVAGGEFSMGSPEAEAGRDGDEGPQHRVRVGGLWVGETEVTQAQWKAVMGAGSNPSHHPGDAFPVENVTWHQAVEFCNALSKLEGKTPAYQIDGTKVKLELEADGYRLPTEAEWEYFARAGTTTRYSFGDDESRLGEYGWYTKNSSVETHLVKTRQPNPWGLYDVHGNVWEWCWDWYAGKYTDNGSDIRSGSVSDNPIGPPNSEYRVLRGGSAWDGAGDLRSANRDWFWPVSRNWSWGFRVVRSFARQHR